MAENGGVLRGSASRESSPLRGSSRGSVGFADDARELASRGSGAAELAPAPEDDQLAAPAELAPASEDDQLAGGAAAVLSPVEQLAMQGSLADSDEEEPLEDAEDEAMLLAASPSELLQLIAAAGAPEPVPHPG